MPGGVLRIDAVQRDLAPGRAQGQVLGQPLGAIERAGLVEGAADMRKPLRNRDHHAEQRHMPGLQHLREQAGGETGQRRLKPFVAPVEIGQTLGRAGLQVDDHGAEQRLLSVEIDVERALGHARFPRAAPFPFSCDFSRESLAGPPSRSPGSCRTLRGSGRLDRRGGRRVVLVPAAPWRALLQHPSRRAWRVLFSCPSPFRFSFKVFFFFATCSNVFPPANRPG